jgi:ribonuclease J
MVSLRFYGGVGEIGGNKILLEEGDTRIWLDFGQSFSMGCDYFVGWLQPRSQNLLGDLLEFDLVPRLEGLYAASLLEGTDLEHVDPLFDGVFVSHAHFDHVNHVGFLDPDIPVFTGAGTKLFMEAMEETSPFTRYGEHDFKSFRTGDRIVVGGLELEPIHVDHSIPGAYAFVVHTSNGAVVYTGDLRAHGPKQDMTEEFLEAAAAAEPVALISEGTRMAERDRRENRSEAEVLEGVKGVCAVADREGNAVFYTHSPRDMDRLRTFYTAAVECGRRLVVTPKTAHLLHRLIEDVHLDLPDPMRDESIGVYYRRKRSGEYREEDYYVWERRFLDEIVTGEGIRGDPAGYVVSLDFTVFTELIDIRPAPGSHFIYSMSEPFSEEDLEDTVMHNWLDHFGLRYHQLHASGHMSRPELVEAVERIGPGKLFPVHTESPHLFARHFSCVVEPVMGEAYEL